MCRKTISTPIDWPRAPPAVRQRQGRPQNAHQMGRADASISCRVRTDRALSSRRRTRAGHRWRSVRQGQSASGAPLRRGDRQAGEDRSPGRGDPGSYGRLAGIAGAPGYKRDPARTEGALRRSRGPGEGSNRRQEPRKSSDALAAETSECSAPRTDRSPDRDSRSGHSPDYRSKRESRRSLRHPDQHSRRIHHHRLCLADRNARARRPRSRPGRQPRRPADCPLIHSRRARRRPPSALHARPRRRSLQSRHEGEIRTPHRNRKTCKSRPDRDHAKACRPLKRPPEGKSPFGARKSLDQHGYSSVAFAGSRAAPPERRR